MNQYQKIGEILVKKGHMTSEQLDHALQVRLADNRRFGEVVLSLGYVTEKQIVECLSEQYDYPQIELALVKPTPDALRCLSPTFALEHLVLPIKVTDRELHCVISDPLDIDFTDKIGHESKKRLVLTLAGPIELFEKINKEYQIIADPNRPAFTTSKRAKDKTGVNRSATRSRVKVDDQPDRRQLLGALGSDKPASVWDWYEVY